MASISNDKGGFKRIQFVDGDGRRCAVRLGKATKKQAEAFKVKLQQLVIATTTGVMDDEVARWVADRDDVIHARLAAVGLVKPRARHAATLKGFLDDYFAHLSV